MRINPQAVIAARRRRGFTQGDLAERVGVSRNAIGNIEAGHTLMPRPYTLRAIADALGVDVDDITTELKVAS